jgi:hypothetical protein
MVGSGVMSGDLKEFLTGVAGEHIDDVIVQLHTSGETFFQALARASVYLNADTARTDFEHEVSLGRIPLKSGAIVALPRLSADGVAAICRFEIESADHDALRAVRTRPSREPEPRMASSELWPALRAAGYATKLSPVDPELSIAHVLLAEATGIGRRTIDRVCSGKQKTIRVVDAITILWEIGNDERARELEERLDTWYESQAADAFDQLEYLHALGSFALAARHQPGLTATERQALDDIVWMSNESQRKTFLGTTPRERLDQTWHSFVTTHERPPIELSEPLQREAETSFRRQSERDEQRAQALRKGLQHTGNAISASAIHVRTHRLRRRGALPDRSAPIGYTTR